MWRRRNARLNNRTGNSHIGDLSSTSTTNEELDSNDEEETCGDLEISSSKVLIMAKSPQTQFHSHEAQTANMKDTIKYLQHQLDMATDKIASLMLDRGDHPIVQRRANADGTDDLNETVERKLREVQFKNNLETALRNVTAQAAVMLAERRDLHRELQHTKSITLATEARMDEQVASTLNQKKNILSKLKAIKSTIVFEDRAAVDDDEDLDINSDDPKNSSGRCFCLPPMFRCWPFTPDIPPDKKEISKTEKERQIAISDNEILDEMNRLYLSITRKLEECSNNATMDINEIETLRGVINDNNTKIAKRGHEIELLRGQLKDTKAQTNLMIKQQAELSAYRVKDKYDSQSLIGDAKSSLNSTDMNSAEQSDYHTDFDYNNNFENKHRKNVLSRGSNGDRKES